MSLLPSLLRVLSSVDGECLVLQSGEQPHVFASGAQVRLDPRGLTSQAVTRVIDRVLSADARRVLEEDGTVHHEFRVPEFPGDRFSAVAALSGDDVWVEIRRRRAPPEDLEVVHAAPAPPEWAAVPEPVTSSSKVEFQPPMISQVVEAASPHTTRSPDVSLPRELQNLTAEPDGLILVAGPSGPRAPGLAAALVDLIRRTRRVRIATVECGRDVVGEEGRSFVSRHMVDGGSHAALDATCAALADNPDVLLLDCALDAALVTLALDAAASGRLVICRAADLRAADAVEAVLKLFPPEDHRVVRYALAHVLRGVVDAASLDFPY